MVRKDKEKPSALSIMANRVAVEPMKLFESLKATVFRNATNEELLALVIVANTYELNPFLKELYAFPAKGGGIVPIVSVDGWNKMLIRQPEFDGIKFSFERDNEGELLSCTATIFVKNRSHPVEVTEYFAECRRNTDPWNNMPYRMLRNRTLCQAVRMAFGFSGIYHEEEVPPGAINIESMVLPNAPAEPPKTIAATEDDKSKAAKETGGAITPQAQLELMVIEGGYTFGNLIKCGEESGNIPDGGSIPDFQSIPTAICNRLLRAKAGLLKGLAEIKALS